MTHMRFPRGTSASKETLCGAAPTPNDLLFGWFTSSSDECQECVKVFADAAGMADRIERRKRTKGGKQ